MTIVRHVQGPAVSSGCSLRQAVRPIHEWRMCNLSLTKARLLIKCAFCFTVNERTNLFLLHGVSRPSRSIVREKMYSLWRSTCWVVKHRVRQTNWSFRCTCDGSPQCLSLRIEHCLFGGLSSSCLLFYMILCNLCFLRGWFMVRLIPKTIGNRKRDCAWGCAWGGINTTWENLQIEKHKSVRWAERMPSWFVLFDLQVFSGGVYSPSATSRTISFSISNSFWY